MRDLIYNIILLILLAILFLMLRDVYGAEKSNIIGEHTYKRCLYKCAEDSSCIAYPLLGDWYIRELCCIENEKCSECMDTCKKIYEEYKKKENNKYNIEMTEGN